MRALQILQILLMLPVMAGLAGCGNGEAAADPGELIVAMPSEGSGLDPHRVTDAPAMRLIENMYGTLLRYTGEYGEVEGDLAEAYEVSEDGRTYTFTLRQGVRFHGGREMIAEDVKYSLERIGRMGARAQEFAVIERIDTPDERTVVLHLSEPSAPLLLHLAYPMNAVVDREVVEAHEGSLENAVGGTGPFRLVEWRRGQHLLMERNPHYHVEGLPRLERVRFRPIPDDSTRRAALVNREIHLMIEVSERDAMLLERQGHLRVSSTPGTFWEYVGMNTDRPPLDDARVRQAIAWAIDREAINQTVKFGRSTPLVGGHIPEHHWAHADLELYPQRDLDRARELLSAAGHDDGLRLSLKVPAEWEPQRNAAQMVQAQLGEAGIQVTLEALELNQVIDAANTGEFDLVLLGWLGFVDPDEWIYNIFRSGGPFNQHGYANDEVDELLARGRATLDRDQRREIYREAQRLIFSDAPMALLYINAQTAAHLDDVKGYVVHPTGTTLWLREVSLDQ